MMLKNWTQFLLPVSLALAEPLLESRQYPTDDFQANCASIAGKLDVENATVYFSQFVAAGQNLSIPDRNVTCGAPYQAVSADICRIALYVATSNSSGINMEAWLPSNFSGRFLSTGNGGLAGCIGYDDMAYTSSLGFASVGANNGHNGTSGGAFYNQPEVVADFAYRSIHTNVVVGKEITKQFYGSPHTKSYYLGCSTGGRQGFKSAQDFPEDFDGIVAGAPALSFNNLTSWSGHFYNLTGPSGSETFVPSALWAVVHGDIMKQCDTLDGYADGILEAASVCNYNASTLLCSGASANASSCLTPTQVKTVQGVFAPLTLPDGSLVYPRMQPGSELLAAAIVYSGVPFPYNVDYFRYAIYNDPAWDPTSISAADYVAAARKNPSNIETWSGDLAAVRDRGAKILHWHGQMDAIISSSNSDRYYAHVAETMGAAPAELDDFYRFFRVSGTGHCSGGDGASAIGQGRGSTQSLDPAENVLMAIVDWVERGNAPETVVGTKWVDGVKAKGVQYKRAHCRYPRRNVYTGEGTPEDPSSWACVE